MSYGIDLVVKVGGSLAGSETDLAGCLRAVGELHRRRPLLVVPGGGPFADTVRAVTERHNTDDSSAHWMAILGMDQYAYVLAAGLPKARIIRRPDEVAASLVEGRLPVLAPSEWIRAADPLPHSWSVSSDSLAAWIAGALGAAKLLLVKRRAERSAVDPYFPDALPAGLAWEVVTPGGPDWLRTSRDSS